MSERWTDAPGLTDLLSHVLYMGHIQQRLTCLSFGILELWAVAAAGRSAVDLGRAGWACGWTHPVRVVCRAGAVRQPGAPADGVPGPSQKPPMTVEILISGRTFFPVRLWRSCSVDSRHVLITLSLSVYSFS